MCGNLSTDEENPRRLEDEDEEKPEEDRVLKNPIVDSLIAPLYYFKYDCKSKLFSYNSFKFKCVGICGLVNEIRPETSHEKMYFIVDDGTAKIKVFGEDLPEELVEEKAAVDTKLEGAVPPLDRDFSLRHMSYVFLWNSEKISQCRPNMKEVKHGDLVYLYGNLCEYRNNRQIFLKYLRKIPSNTMKFRYDWLYQCLERIGK